MRSSITILLLGHLLMMGCQKPKKTTDQATQEELILAFGSCNRQDDPQPMWGEIIANQPDVWIWLGDNIYGDSEIVDTLIAKYNRQLANPGYQQLTSIAEVIGTWDDHDYGINDGGVAFDSKVESQQAFLDFFGVAADDARRKRAGVYSATTYRVGTKKVKVLLLDSRYHRDPIQRIEGVYQKNLQGTVLGEAQWQWLEEQLTGSEADLHLIGNGIQIVAEEHRFEKWANFPQERKRLFELIGRSGARGVVLLTGDRHIAEVSEIIYEGIDYPLRDITSSGLTHSYEEAGDEPNEYRISPLIGQKNYGVIRLEDKGAYINLSLQIKGLEGKVFYESSWTY